MGIMVPAWFTCFASLWQRRLQKQRAVELTQINTTILYRAKYLTNIAGRLANVDNKNTHTNDLRHKV